MLNTLKSQSCAIAEFIYSFFSLSYNNKNTSVCFIFQLQKSKKGTGKWKNALIVQSAWIGKTTTILYASLQKVLLSILPSSHHRKLLSSCFVFLPLFISTSFLFLFYFSKYTKRTENKHRELFLIGIYAWYTQNDEMKTLF